MKYRKATFEPRWMASTWRGWRPISYSPTSRFFGPASCHFLISDTLLQIAMESRKYLNPAMRRGLQKLGLKPMARSNCECKFPKREQKTFLFFLPFRCHPLIDTWQWMDGFYFFSFLQLFWSLILWFHKQDSFFGPCPGLSASVRR